jgi:hypothetical protein
MSDHPRNPSQEQESERTSGTQPSDRKAERAPADPQQDDGNAQQPGASRPRGKTEDPDQTL